MNDCPDGNPAAILWLSEVYIGQQCYSDVTDFLYVLLYLVFDCCKTFKKQWAISLEQINIKWIQLDFLRLLILLWDQTELVINWAASTHIENNQTQSLVHRDQNIHQNHHNKHKIRLYPHYSTCIIYSACFQLLSLYTMQYKNKHKHSNKTLFHSVYVLVRHIYRHIQNRFHLHILYTVTRAFHQPWTVHTLTFLIWTN